MPAKAEILKSPTHTTNADPSANPVTSSKALEYSLRWNDSKTEINITH